MSLLLYLIAGKGISMQEPEYNVSENSKSVMVCTEITCSGPSQFLNVPIIATISTYDGSATGMSHDAFNIHISRACCIHITYFKT